METTFEKISRKSGKKPSNCKCQECKTQCTTPCLGTPEDIAKLIGAGYGHRLRPTSWGVGILMGVVDFEVSMVQAEYDEEKGSCTFLNNGLCELHEKGLKPTEGRLSHHSTTLEKFQNSKSLSWLVAQEWLRLNAHQIKILIDVVNEKRRTGPVHYL